MVKFQNVQEPIYHGNILTFRFLFDKRGIGLSISRHYTLMTFFFTLNPFNVKEQIIHNTYGMSEGIGHRGLK